jgi:hypothetical protein
LPFTVSCDLWVRVLETLRVHMIGCSPKDIHRQSKQGNWLKSSRLLVHHTEFDNPAHPDTVPSWSSCRHDGVLSMREALLVRLSVGTIAQSGPQTASN